MFYQVRIPEYQRKYLSFLWWSDGDISKGIQESLREKWCFPMRKRQQIRRKTPGNMCCLAFSGGFVDVFSSENTIFSRSEYEMYVHVFGGTSLPGCNTYALKRTAKEGEEEYGIEAKETLEKDFYVNDMLKSVENDETAIDLMKNVVGMCHTGGFNLTKVISNSEDVLQSIDIKRRHQNVKNCD